MCLWFRLFSHSGRETFQSHPEQDWKMHFSDLALIRMKRNENNNAIEGYASILEIKPLFQKLQ